MSSYVYTLRYRTLDGEPARYQFVSTKGFKDVYIESSRKVREDYPDQEIFELSLARVEGDTITDNEEPEYER